MMLLDGGWLDAFVEFLEVALQKKFGIKNQVIASLEKLMGQETYKELIFTVLGEMLRRNETSGAALEYIADLGSRDLALALKKELIIFARGDIGENQQNAIRAISSIRDEDDVKKSFMILLSHWDREARMAAALALVGTKERDVKAAAEKKLDTESDDEIKRILKRIAK
jgi:hypothetical protein